MVGRAPSILGVRLGAFAALAGALAAYYAVVDSLPTISVWWGVAFLSLVVVPAVFGLVYLALPLFRHRGLVLVGLAFVALAAICEAADLGALANFAKLGAVTCIAFWFLTYFESLSWVVLVAAIVPWVDAWSVWQGPTHAIVSQRKEIFTTLSFAFPAPGERGSANLGLPDLLFFALFLATTARFRLRTGWTWLAMMLSLGATMAFAVGFALNGLPALPGLSITFLAVNADLLWRRLRPRRAPA